MDEMHLDNNVLTGTLPSSWGSITEVWLYQYHNAAHVCKCLGIYVCAVSTSHARVSLEASSWHPEQLAKLVT